MGSIPGQGMKILQAMGQLMIFFKEKFKKSGHKCYKLKHYFYMYPSTFKLCNKISD